MVLCQKFLQRSSPNISNNAHRLSENKSRLALVCRLLCTYFDDHFTIPCDNRSLRSNVKPKLVTPIFKRKFVLQSFFPRATQLVNDFHYSTEIDLIIPIPSHNFKDLLRQYFLLLTRTKYDSNRTCTWHIKCKCSFCVS